MVQEYYRLSGAGTEGERKNPAGPFRDTLNKLGLEEFKRLGRSWTEALRALGKRRVLKRFSGFFKVEALTASGAGGPSGTAASTWAAKEFQGFLECFALLDPAKVNLHSKAHAPRLRVAVELHLLDHLLRCTDQGGCVTVDHLLSGQ